MAEKGEVTATWAGRGRVGDLGAAVNLTSALQVWAGSRSPGTISQVSAPRTTGTPRTSLPHFHHPGRFYCRPGCTLFLGSLFSFRNPSPLLSVPHHLGL